MSDEVENTLANLTPRGAPPELRARILAAVGDELAATEEPPKSYRRFPIGLATAAALLLSVTADRLATWVDEERVERAFGPRPVSPAVLELVQDIAKVAGPETGRLALERLSAPPPPPTDAELIRQAAEVARMIQELAHDSPENARETATQKIPQADRDRDRRRAGRVLLVERLLHTDHRPSA
ncbi:hypothetical protein [Paludisphaera rhizosphaerae]|uniref:hypothetical protein n=1 Tax=Paludisphaera rhizosphaerae TaxID=2711216 RepID=UPI0013EA6479|nr:hypothetical protein [Paludisphaera rhizosphaerae]